MPIFVVLLTISGLFWSCHNPTKSDNKQITDAIYFFSFEKDADTVGWHNTLDPHWFKKLDNAPEGEKTLGIGGSCIMPTAYFTDNFKGLTGRYKLAGWLKVAYGSGVSVGLRRLNLDLYLYSGLSISSSGTAWQYFESDSSIWIQQGEPIELDILSGGLLPTYGYFDGLSILPAEE